LWVGTSKSLNCTSFWKSLNPPLCSDAVNGSCSVGEFRCETGAKCLPSRWTCDGGESCSCLACDEYNNCSYLSCDGGKSCSCLESDGGKSCSYFVYDERWELFMFGLWRLWGLSCLTCGEVTVYSLVWSMFELWW
jgi:hypothetical protein